MEYRTKSCRVLTDAMIEELAAQAERGDYPGKAGKMLVAPQGRPPLCDEELVTVAFKIPRSFRDKLDKAAHGKNESRSQFLREALEAALG